MSDYLLIFLAGFLGSVHCMGMCGGIVAACSMRFGGGLRFSLTYNTGRVLMYVLLGGLMGLLGKSLIATGFFGSFQSVLPVIAGAFMVIVGLELLGAFSSAAKGPFSALLPGRLLDRLFVSRLKAERPAPFVLGMFNGLIPCAFLYAAGLKAASLADPFSGMLVMASLGAGTFMPLLFAGGYANRLKGASRWLRLAASSIIIAIGLKTLVYGAGATEAVHSFYTLCTTQIF